MQMSRLLYVLFFLLLVSESTLSAIQCQKVIADLAPCLSYLRGKADVSPQCCSGVKNLKAIAKTKADRVGICNCGKQALSKSDYDPNRIPLLPKKCGVDATMPPIDKNYDCSKVSA